MLWLLEECFSKLRLHTYHLTGDNYQTYYFGTPDSLRPLWEECVKDIPSEYVLSEPAGGIGFDFSYVGLRYDGGHRWDKADKNLALLDETFTLAYFDGYVVVADS